MYRELLGLRAAPFPTITTETAFPSRALLAAEARLREALDDDAAFCWISGEAGAGKSLLARRLVLAAVRHCVAHEVLLENPPLGPDALIRALADRLGLAEHDDPGSAHGGADHDADRGTAALRTQVERAMSARARSGGGVVLALDECQALAAETLECLRLLAAAGCARVVLFGQPEFDATLQRPELAAVRGRLGAMHRIGLLLPDETPAFLAHGLRTAGYAGQGPGPFPLAVAALVHRAAHGNPRLTGRVAHRALQIAARQGLQAVDAAQVRAAVEETPAAARLGLLSRASGWLGRAAGIVAG